MIYAPIITGLGAGAAVCALSGMLIMIILNLVLKTDQPQLLVSSLCHLTIGPAALVAGLIGAYTCRLQSAPARCNPVAIAVIVALLHAAIWIFPLRTFLFLIPSLFALDLLLVMFVPILVWKANRR